MKKVYFVKIILNNGFNAKIYNNTFKFNKASLEEISHITHRSKENNLFLTDADFKLSTVSLQ
jgi:hypothetical protein